MNELQAMVDLHRNTQRQGPGSIRDTKRALDALSLDKNKSYEIADIGCGTGGQSLVLAEELNGHITAVDLFPEFLAELNIRKAKRALKAQIETLECSMDHLPFKKESLDLIWSEGAIYLMGFENGIKSWRNFLKKGGFIAVSEITWKTSARPKELEDYWQNAYVEMDTASNKVKVLEENGFAPLAYHMLEESSWIDKYYRPLEKEYAPFLHRQKHSKLAESIVKESQDEFEMYLKFKDYYSYGFYLAQKI